MFDRHRVSKALSKIASASIAELLAIPAPDRPRHSRVIGVTGAPGAGKSSLIGKLVAARLRHAATVAVIAIDPTSPRSDGSLLGDRVRLAALSEDPRVFIRSLPSRAAEDGLTDNLTEIIDVLDGFGFDEIVVETVGAGQATHGVHALADVVVLVLTPGAGDYIQAMKAGIMETADIYVVNKSDLPGADRVVAEVLGVLRHHGAGSAPPVIQFRQDRPEGIDVLDGALQERFAAWPTEPQDSVRRRARRRFQVRTLLHRRLNEAIAALPDAAWNETVGASYDEVLRALVRDV